MEHKRNRWRMAVRGFAVNEGRVMERMRYTSMARRVERSDTVAQARLRLRRSPGFRRGFDILPQDQARYTTP